jgi:multicomponent Na+:H+ antiporter subunit F
MIPDAELVLPWVLDGLMILLPLAALCAFVRLILGPSLPDRVVALDLIVMILVGLIAVYTIKTGQESLLRIAMVLALLAFLGTVSFARYLEKRGPE